MKILEIHLTNPRYNRFLKGDDKVLMVGKTRYWELQLFREVGTFHHFDAVRLYYGYTDIHCDFECKELFMGSDAFYVVLGDKILNKNL